MDPLSHHQRSRRGFSLTELLIVTVLGLVIVGLLLPAIDMVRESGASTHRCGNNQWRIFQAITVYANDNDQTWPVMTTSATGMQVPAGDARFNATATAIASCEFLMEVIECDLTAKHFACPANPTAWPAAAHGYFGPNGPHYSAWAANGPTCIGYAYDWSVPAQAADTRVVLADRHVIAHKGFVFATYADGHFDRLNAIGSAYINRRVAGSDDIYSGTGDGPMAVPGAGSTTRAFVR